MEEDDVIAVVAIIAIVLVIGAIGAFFNHCFEKRSHEKAMQELREQLNTPPPTTTQVTILKKIDDKYDPKNVVEDSHGVRAILEGEWGKEGDTFSVAVESLKDYDSIHLKFPTKEAGDQPDTSREAE